MPKLLTLICESMVASDAETLDLPGLERHEFELRPARYSMEALWLMQTGDPEPDWHAMPLDRTGPNVFATPGRFVSNYAKTRLISYFWHARHNPIPLDPLCTHSWLDSQGKLRQPVSMEPGAYHWPVFLEFLSAEFYRSDYQWLIYWPLIGHAAVGCRLRGEDHGIPDTLRETTAEWFTLIQNRVLPLVQPGTVVLIHSDHGTLRRNKPDSMRRGIFFCSPPIHGVDMDWRNLRMIERTVLGVDKRMRDAGCTL
jgi:hypothetical protein